MHAIKRLIPNLFTAGNLVGGILAIIFALTGRIDIAPYCIFASAIFDFLDGFMARLLKVPSEMGKQLDSLADMVTFGVAPGVITLVMFTVTFFDSPYGYLSGIWSSLNQMYLESEIVNVGFLNSNGSLSLQLYTNDDIEYFFPFVAFLIPVFALFRLAKFNIDNRQSDSFIGLPTPAMTLFFAVLPLLCHESLNGHLTGEIDVNNWKFAAGRIIINPWFLSISSLVMSILMVAELPLFALKFKHFKFKGNEIRYIFLTICVGLLATLFFWAIPLIIILYVILSLINTRIAK